MLKKEIKGGNQGNQVYQLCCVYYTVKENVEKNQSKGAIRAIGSVSHLCGSGRCVYYIFLKNRIFKENVEKRNQRGQSGQSVVHQLCLNEYVEKKKSKGAIRAIRSQIQCAVSITQSKKMLRKINQRILVW